MLAVTGIGMVSSLGSGATEGCAASRAGLLRISELPDSPVWDSDSGRSEPARGHTVPWVAGGFVGLGRRVALAAAALRDLDPTLSWAADSPRTAFHLTSSNDFHRHILEQRGLLSPEHDGRLVGDTQRLIPSLLKILGVPSRPRAQQLRFGEKGFLHALEEASRQLSAGEPPSRASTSPAMPSDTHAYFLLRWEVLDGYCAVFDFAEGMKQTFKPATGVRMGEAYAPGTRFKMAKEERGLKIADVIPNALGYFMVSARMKDLLEKHAGAEIEFLRFTLINHKGRVASEDCYIANLIGTHDCVDPEKSDGDRDALKPQRFMYVRRLVLAQDKVDPQARLFRTTTVPQLLIIRGDLKDLFEKEGITGPTYNPVGSDVAFTP